MAPPQQTRQTPLKVLALGLPRTGTASMAQALTRLGFTHCAHGMDMLDDEAYAGRFEPLLDAKYFGGSAPLDRAAFDALLGHCSAVTDMPCAMLWRELHAAYPEAKVVLVERDVDAWYKSFSEGVIDSTWGREGAFSRNYIEPLTGTRLGAVSLKSLQGPFGMTEAEMRANAKDVYKRHYEEIRATVPPGQLLEFQLKEGWAPLCGFLGIEVPDEEFPRINDADALKAKIAEYLAKKKVELKNNVLFKWLPGLAVAVGVYALWRRR